MIDFYASERHYVDHLVPVWEALGAKSHFIVTLDLCEYLKSMVTEPGRVKGVRSPAEFRSFRDDKYVLVAGYRDIQAVQRAGYRHVAFMEHGVGITYGLHRSYAGGRGERTQVELFLAPNEIVRVKTEKALPGVRQAVVGTPKLDGWKAEGRRQNAEYEKSVVAVSFHWDGARVVPEAGTAFAHFRKILPVLARRGKFELIGHGHPRAMGKLRHEYERMGIEVVTDFEEVMRRADVYVCDNSSTIYEFLVTGKPVVLLNAPEYRKKVNWGIRFWDYTDVGPCIDEPEELLSAISGQLSAVSDQRSADGGERYAEAREKAVRELYPFLGESAVRAAEALREWGNEE